MGQKANPISLRLGYIRGWESNWFSTKHGYAEKLFEDNKIRNYIYTRIPKGEIAKVVIERTLKCVTLTLHTARPGIIIGKGGVEVDKLKQELKKITNKEIQINIFEIKRPEIDAKLVANTVAKQLKARMSYRRVIKQAIAAAMRNGARGIKISIAGRINGAEMARIEHYKEGRIPLHTLRADIDYYSADTNTNYGKLGVKVWIFKREIYEKNDLSLNIVQYDKNRKKEKFRSKK